MKRERMHGPNEDTDLTTGVSSGRHFFTADFGYALGAPEASISRCAGEWNRCLWQECRMLTDISSREDLVGGPPTTLTSNLQPW